MKLILDADDVRVILEDYAKETLPPISGKKLIAYVGYITPVTIEYEDDPIEVPKSTNDTVEVTNYDNNL